MPRAVTELRQIPFGYLIGAPLKAAVEAQALAARTTVEFIEKVGFKETDDDIGSLFNDLSADADSGEIRNVTFSYVKQDEDGVDTAVELTVPILSIVPIPFLRLDDITIDFTAKLTDIVQSTTKSDFKFATDAKGKFKAWWSPVSMEVRTAVSYQNTRESSSKYVREYTMNIKVHAVQDDIPAGLERILDILEQTITEKPASP
ncbi:MAG: DUF2589 domain-containing protein [Anaerolineae bacterium]|nr:DUF2589 domain-containing protein [Anaerolineae bacterium]